MSEIKYTTDGKKVVVIGNLNSIEKIVQEVFIVDGSEIPSGEHFVVKSLHDAPAVSWKENNLKKLEERYASEEREFEKLQRQVRDKSKEFRERYDYLTKAIKNANEKSFELLRDFICGEIKYIVIANYTPELLAWDEFNKTYENRLRLMSIFGKDDGTFTYAVGDYYDYSGSHKHFIPFKNYDDAFEKFKSLLLSEPITDDRLKIAEKHKIVFTDDMMRDYVSKKVESLNKNILSYTDQIGKWNESINELKKLNP